MIIFRVLVYNFMKIVPIRAGASMTKSLLYLLLLIPSMPLTTMEKTGQLQVFLAAPEYWIADGKEYKQCDLDENGEPCPVGCREQQLELTYVNTFPGLKSYLEKNNNTLKGFDPQMFKLLQNCLRLAYTYQTSSDDKKSIKREIQALYRDKYSPAQIVDSLYISRLAGLRLIEKLAINAFKEKKDSQGRLLRVSDVYPSFKSLDEICPYQPVDVSDSIDLDSDQESVSGDPKSEEANTSEVEAEFKKTSPSLFATLFAWIKSFLPHKQSPISQNTCKEIAPYQVSPFAKLKIKQPDTWFQKIKSWLALILWK